LSDVHLFEVQSALALQSPATALCAHLSVVQVALRQSVPAAHVLVAPHGPHLAPPQSTSVSPFVASRVPLEQSAVTHACAAVSQCGLVAVVHCVSALHSTQAPVASQMLPPPLVQGVPSASGVVAHALFVHVGARQSPTVSAHIAATHPEPPVPDELEDPPPVVVVVAPPVVVVAVVLPVPVPPPAPVSAMRLRSTEAMSSQPVTRVDIPAVARTAATRRLPVRIFICSSRLRTS
jgi:hypothetical protein